jgi:hypothetical protein
MMLCIIYDQLMLFMLHGKKILSSFAVVLKEILVYMIESIGLAN